MRAGESGAENEPVVVLVREPGTISYWAESDQYLVDFFVEGTIDSVRSGLVEELDEKFRQPGLKVLVSGKLFQPPDLPPPRLGGQEIYALEISELSVPEE